MRTFLVILLLSTSLLGEDLYPPTGKYSPEAIQAAKAAEASKVLHAKLDQVAAQNEELAQSLDTLAASVAILHSKLPSEVEAPKPPEVQEPKASSSLVEKLIQKPTAAPTQKTVKGHSHKCANCGTVWSHPDNSNAPGAHSCPNCGKFQFNQHNENVAVKVNTSSVPVAAPIQYKASYTYSSGCVGGNCPTVGRIFRRRNR